jgi:hypothetical protein
MTIAIGIVSFSTQKPTLALVHDLSPHDDAEKSFAAGADHFKGVAYVARKQP